MRSVLWRVETRRALCRGWPPGQSAQRSIGAPQGTSRRVGRQRHGAPRSTRSAPLAINASHLKIHNTL
ncbi:hypothetical protein C9397_14225 [Xanthomonas vasicola pv. vasculorum]|uniref:Uncharacterized protein n=2 Tax=Xanthomonas vasicola TaxID=56459 RepID=A0ABD7SDY5_XANVA|nr:hypothetical protein C7V42_20725 [Xanthomonas vasicola pv. vasculorum]AZR24438.1 hypothetical protein NX81_021685 [Xanthomonas vasicola]AZR28559.1 hypothetical protein NX80_021235 [Xanthomonas vasicola pv. arecae]AZR32072.1 hypothetical protein KWO_017780 [Xanthomonas vasicola pv. musacearum NCPPB 4379]RRJ42500.1 hypothetical protein EIM46_05895 [Xanthomonas vasicola pv. musacearum]